jgi:hypothetical protein
MAEQIDIAGLSRKSAAERLAAYAAELPDGKAVYLADVTQELDMNYTPCLHAARKAGLIFNAFISGSGGGPRAMLANPKTVKAWQEAQQTMPPKKRSTSRT